MPTAHPSPRRSLLASAVSIAAERWLSVLLGLGFEPLLHLGDLALLLADDVVGPLLGLIILAVLEDDSGHVDRTLVMRDHRLHERHVRIGILHGLHHGTIHLIHCGHIGLCRVGLRCSWACLTLAHPALAHHAALHHAHAALGHVLHHSPTLLRHALHHGAHRCLRLRLSWCGSRRPGR